MVQKGCIAALVSGGIESAYLLQHVVARGVRVQPLYVAQGYRWERIERRWLRRLLRHWPRRQVAPLVVLETPITSFVGQHWALGHGRVPGARTPDQAMALPGRNLWLFTAAGLWCARHGIHRIAHGTLATNPFPDASADFFRGMRDVLSRALGCRFRLEAPLRHLTKAEIIQRLPPALLRCTFSCINPQRGRHCGRCNKCAERQRAFRAAHLPDPTRYVREAWIVRQHIQTTELGKQRGTEAQRQRKAPENVLGHRT